MELFSVITGFIIAAIIIPVFQNIIASFFYDQLKVTYKNLAFKSRVRKIEAIKFNYDKTIYYRQNIISLMSLASGRIIRMLGGILLILSSLTILVIVPDGIFTILKITILLLVTAMVFIELSGCMDAIRLFNNVNFFDYYIIKTVEQLKKLECTDEEVQEILRIKSAPIEGGEK